MKLFIEESLTKSTLDWVLEESNRDSYLNEEGEYGKYHNFFPENKELIEELGLHYDNIEIIDQIILSHYGLDLDTPLDDNFGYQLNWQTKGYSKEPSRTDNLKGKISVRFNVMLQKPSRGGKVIIGDKLKIYKNNEVWVEVSGIDKYGVEENKGNKDRIFLSLGHLVDEDVVKEKGWMDPNCKPISESPMWNKDSNYDNTKYYPYVDPSKRKDISKLIEIDEEKKADRARTLMIELRDEETTLVRRNIIRKVLGYVEEQVS